MPEHQIKRTLQEIQNVPEHPKRETSSLFRHNREKLIKDGHGECWICGAKESLECHHIFEWSLWNALDPDKALEVLELLDPYGYAEELNGTMFDSPDDIRNLWMLCDDHHDSKYQGIHNISFPLWLAQKVDEPGEEVTPEEDEK